MNTYLFVWNPNKWDWIAAKQENGQLNLEQSIARLFETGKLTDKWSVTSYNSIKEGDRAFLMRVGKEPKGIFASGFISSLPFLSRHWSGVNKNVYRVLIDFDVLLNPEKESILSLNILNTGNLINQHWTPQGSGISIKSELVDELESVWFDFLTTEKTNVPHLTSFEIESGRPLTEGRPSKVVLTRYERNPYARKICINYYGLNCAVCDLNFEVVYGSIGKDFIHVHHLTPVAKIKNIHKVNPIEDLRPVCPNCHAMIHIKKQPLSIEGMKHLLKVKN